MPPSAVEGVLLSADLVEPLVFDFQIDLRLRGANTCGDSTKEARVYAAHCGDAGVECEWAA